MGFDASPYHYCAVAGETELAVYLYSKGIEMCSNITVASFSAAGTNGNTPWKKIIMITPHEAALLAGLWWASVVYPTRVAVISYWSIRNARCALYNLQ